MKECHHQLPRMEKRFHSTERRSARKRMSMPLKDIGIRVRVEIKKKQLRPRPLKLMWMLQSSNQTKQKKKRKTLKRRYYWKVLPWIPSCYWMSIVTTRYTKTSWKTCGKPWTNPVNQISKWNGLLKWKKRRILWINMTWCLCSKMHRI